MNERLSCWLPLVGLVISACSAGDPSDPDVSSPERTSVPEGTSGAEESYVVLYKDHAVPSDATATVAAAGGTVVTAYSALGVVVAKSSDPSFSDELLTDARIDAVSRSSSLRSAMDFGENTPALSASEPTPSSWGDPLSGLQWNMTQIHAPEAQAINPGSSSVLVGVIDSGIDITHPDLATQVDVSASVSCVGGVANPDPDVWALDFFGHGTHVAGIIAGAANGIGIVGVAPGVRVAAIQVIDENGFIFPEDFICGLTWAADHGMDLANASLFIDPWEFACKNDPEQRAILQAVQRAVEYASDKGTTLLSATGNSNEDLANPTFDFISPTNGEPLTRELNNNCETLPVELAGVVGVSAVGATQLKAFYSNYGIDAVDVTGPGGDFLVITPEAETGQVVSALPPDSLFYFLAKEVFGTGYEDCSSGTCFTYGGLQGTSMSTPHATGVAALAISRHGKMTPDALTSVLKETATALPCPPNPYDPAPDFVLPATCTGGAEHNNFYGSGEVDALAVVE